MRFSMPMPLTEEATFKNERKSKASDTKSKPKNTINDLSPIGQSREGKKF
jgi:hypothetical protein